MHRRTVLAKIEVNMYWVSAFSFLPLSKDWAGKTGRIFQFSHVRKGRIRGDNDNVDSISVGMLNWKNIPCEMCVVHRNLES